MISQSEIVYGSSSLIDDVGRVFFWNGGVYRAIHPKYVNYFRELLEKDVLIDLFDKKVVRTKISPQSLEGYELTLQHHRVQFVSFCAEWGSEMLRDAALFYCDLVVDLDKRGLGLKDAHPWNVLFDQGYPILVDLGSITGDRTWPAHVYQEFQNWFVMPLLLMSGGLSNLARTLFLNVGNPPSTRNVLKLLIGRVSPGVWLHYWLNLIILRSIASKDGVKAFRYAQGMVKSISIKSETTEWTNYMGPGSIFSIDETSEWNAKSLNVQSILERLKPKTVIDIGCNRGWFSEIAVRAGAQTVAADIDEPTINNLYQQIRISRKSILPLLMDVSMPTPPHGFSYPAASIRLKSDLVLALAITHHLVFKRGLSFEGIAERLSTFSSRWLIVEFVPPDDQYVREWISNKYDWYCLKGFIKALERYFRHIDILDSYPSPRVLLLCEK